MKNRESVEVAPYALYDVLHAFHRNDIECKVGKEDGNLVVFYCKRRKKVAAVATEGVAPCP